MKRILLCILCLAFFAVVLPACKSLTAGRHEEKIDDRAIVARIRTLISEDPALSPSDIRVFAIDGRVTLSGTVPDVHAKSRLLTGARGVKEVRSVSDNLEIPVPR